MRAAYDELVDELLEERSEALRIAQAYKAELERVQISDDDIQSLDATIARVLEIFVSMQSNGEEPSNPAPAMSALLEEGRRIVDERSEAEFKRRKAMEGELNEGEGV